MFKKQPDFSEDAPRDLQPLSTIKPLRPVNIEPAETAPEAKQPEKGTPEKSALEKSLLEKRKKLAIEPETKNETREPASGSVIGADLTILGENLNIVSRETLQIDGEIHGDVRGKKVTIGPNGTVAGTVSAEKVVIDGKVEGLVRAGDIRLNADAKVTGDLLHQSLVIVEGAEFEGSVHRPADASTLKPDLGGAEAMEDTSPHHQDAPAAPMAAPMARTAAHEPLGAPPAREENQGQDS